MSEKSNHIVNCATTIKNFVNFNVVLPLKTDDCVLCFFFPKSIRDQNRQGKIMQGQRKIRKKKKKNVNMKLKTEQISDIKQ